MAFGGAGLHVVRDGGAQAWDRPDGSVAPVDVLDGGLHVEVLEVAGVWHHIRCENGWTAWVDGRNLMPRPTGPPRAQPAMPQAVYAQPYAPVARPVQVGQPWPAAGYPPVKRSHGCLKTIVVFVVLCLLVGIGGVLALRHAARRGSLDAAQQARVTAAVAAFEAQPHAKASGSADLQALADQLSTIAREANGATGAQEAVDAAMDEALSTEPGRVAYSTIASALDGATATVKGLGESKLASFGAGSIDGHPVQLAAARPNTLSVYFVNGVLNGPADLIASGLQLSEAYGGIDITVIYNHSAVLQPNLVRFQACFRALANKYGLVTDPNEAWSTWISKALSDPKLAGLRAACAATDVVIDGASSIATVTGDLIVSAVQLVGQRLFNSDLVSTPVNAALVPLAERDIEAGRRVVVVGHSQGTYFVRNALSQVAAWWKAKWEKGELGCPDASGKRTTPTGEPPDLPMGALYIAPGFGTGDWPGQSFFGHDGNGRPLQIGNQRYVSLREDAIHSIGIRAIGLAPVIPTANARRDQKDNVLIPGVGTHALATYLFPGTESRHQIIDRFGQLKRYVQGLKDVADCGQPEVGPVFFLGGKFRITKITETPSGCSDNKVGEDFSVTYDILAMEISLPSGDDLAGRFEVATTGIGKDSWVAGELKDGAKSMKVTFTEPKAERELTGTFTGPGCSATILATRLAVQ